MKKLSLLILLFLAVAAPITTQAQTGKNEALTAMGGSCGMLLYNTYLAIGATADAYGYEAYEAQFVADLMTEQINTIATVKSQYSGLIKSGFLTDPNDKEYMGQAIKCLDLLSKQAQALSDYVLGGANASTDAFDAAREASWAKVAEMLGIE